MFNIINILKDKINNIKNKLDTNPEYNRTRDARSEVERRILKWENLLSSINDSNVSSIESTINIDISQLDKDIFAINSASDSLKNDSVAKAIKEAENLILRHNNYKTNVDSNVSRLNKSRELMRNAGLI